MSPATISARRGGSRVPAGKPRGQSKKTKADKAAQAAILEQSGETLASQLMEAHPDQDDPIEPDEDRSESEDDDPDGVDPVVEYGEDLEHTDGDSSESEEAPSQWDRADSRHEGALPLRPDLTVRPGEGDSDWTVELTRPAMAFGLNGLSPIDQDRRAQRDVSAIAIGRAVVGQQSKYLETGDADDLRDLTQRTIAVQAQRDEGTVSRLLEHLLMELADGRVVPLRELVPDSKYVRIRAIAALFRQHDRLERDSTGAVTTVMHLMTGEDVVKEMQRRFGKKGNSLRTIQVIVAVSDLPLDPPKRRLYYTEGRDWWTTSF